MRTGKRKRKKPELKDNEPINAYTEDEVQETTEEELKEAEEKGHNKISDLKGCDGYAGLAVSCNRIKPNRKAVELFLRAYNIAVDSMKIYAEQPLPKYITTHFNIDSIPLKVIKSKSLSHLYHPETKKIASALLWARKNNFATKAYNTDTLTYK